MSLLTDSIVVAISQVCSTISTSTVLIKNFILDRLLCWRLAVFCSQALSKLWCTKSYSNSFVCIDICIKLHNVRINYFRNTCCTTTTVCSMDFYHSFTRKSPLLVRAIFTGASVFIRCFFCLSSSFHFISLTYCWIPLK